ncbi:helix-turn-helix domain-containing protein [Aquisphaera insulae]|uniref:helix-turn-helix domain-containing protein n=1 Tax=Aquisphaera insulae TaxID=2712864 RepID=UPI0013EA87B2|nr:helix-turn-helix domain-containing protein [Aquisphaera insulae]
MILVHLDEATRGELKSLRRTDLPPRVRDRLEMVLLSSVAWAPARIASHTGYCTATVRGVLKDFQARGVPSLHPKRTGPPPDHGRREAVEGLLRECLGEARTWTSRQLAAALSERGVDLSPRQVRRYLGGMGAGWRRTADSLRHKQDPAKVARARHVLDNLKKKRPPAA